MGGFSVPFQAFSIYQAIHWIQENGEVQNQINGIRRIRQMVETNRADEVIRLGVPPRLVELFVSTNCNVLKSEIIWTLANIAAGTSSQTEYIIRKALPVFISMLEGSDEDFLKKDILWALSNIAGDSPKCRDRLLEVGVMDLTLKFLLATQDEECERNGVWLIANLCRHQNPIPDFALIQPSIPTLMNYLEHGNCEILVNTCWALKYIAEGSPSQLETLIDSGVCGPMLRLLESKNVAVVIGALLVLSNISAARIEVCQAIIDAKLAPAIINLIDSDDEKVLKNAIFVLSNITAGSVDQIQHLIDYKMFEKMIERFEKCQTLSQKEIIHTIANLVSEGNSDQLAHVAKLGGWKILEAGVLLEDFDVVRLSLEAFKSLFDKTQYREQYHYDAVDSCWNKKEFFYKLNVLQLRGDDETQRLADSFFDLLAWLNSNPQKNYGYFPGPFEN